MKKINYLYILLIISFYSQGVLANLKIDITQGNTEPIPLAILEFNSETKETKVLSKKIFKVISSNLERSGLFEVVSKKSLLETRLSFNKIPEFSNWRVTKAQGLVHGRILNISGDKVKLEFRLWDILSEKQMEAQQLTTTISNWRRISHVISDIIYKRITGENGYFDSRIVYISESGKKNK